MAYYADISRYRPVKDWRLVKRNCPFLISKATEGTDYTYPTLDDFIRGCENNEIPYCRKRKEVHAVYRLCGLQQISGDHPVTPVRLRMVGITVWPE